MHLLKHRAPKSQKIVNVKSHFVIPFHRKMRGKRYDANGRFLCETGPRRTVDVCEQQKVLKAREEAAQLPKPAETPDFDLNGFSPLADRLLLKLPPPITHEKGVEIPEGQQRNQPYFIVVRPGAATPFKAGDKVIFNRRQRPHAVRLARGHNYHLGRAKWVIAVVE